MLGSATTAAGLIASMIAMYFVIREWPLKLGSGQKYLLTVYLFYFFYFVAVGTARESLWDGIDGMVPNLPILFFAALIVLLPKRAPKITHVQLGLLATYAVIGTSGLALIEHHFGGCGRVNLLSGNALVFATLMLGLTFLSALGWSLKSTTQKRQCLAGICLGIFSIAFLAQSKGVTLASVPLLLALGWRLQLGFAKGLAVILLIIGTVVILGVLDESACSGNSGAFDRYIGVEKHGRSGDSVSQRLTIWKAGWEAAKTNPIFGHGPQNRFSAIIPYFTDSELKKSHLHNTLLTHLVSGGVVGLLSFLTVILSPIALLIFKVSPTKDDFYFGLVIIGTAQTGLTNLLFNHDLLTSYFSFFPIAMLSLMDIDGANNSSKNGNT